MRKLKHTSFVLFLNYDLINQAAVLIQKLIIYKLTDTDGVPDALIFCTILRVGVSGPHLRLFLEGGVTASEDILERFLDDEGVDTLASVNGTSLFSHNWMH